MSGGPLPVASLLGELAALPNRERLGRLRDHGRADDLIVKLADEVERLTFVEVSRALLMSEMLVALADEMDAPRGRSRTRRARAQALAYAGRLEESLAMCQSAITIASHANEGLEVARAQLASLHPLGELARYEEAVRAGESAAITFRAAGEELLAAKADINLGGIHQNRADPVRALFHLDRAKQALADQPMLTGFVENNRGEALLLLHDFSGAQQAFVAALAASEKAGASLAAAISEGNLGDLAARRGSLPQAMLHFERARRRLEADAAPSHLARLIAEHAEALETLGLPDDALAVYQTALPQLEQHGLAWEAARARLGVGRALLHLGRTDEAEASLTAARNAFEQLKHATPAARADLLLAEIEAARGFDAAASARLSAAQDALADNPADLAVLRLKRARIELKLGQESAADADLELGLRFARELGASPLIADLLHTRGRLREVQARHDDAVADLRAAVREVERVRGALQAERFRSAYLRDRLAIYDDLARELLDRSDGSWAEAFNAVEAAKSRALLDAVQGALAVASSQDTDPAEGRLRERCATLRAELNVLYSQLADSTGQRLGGWTQAVQQRERDLQTLEARLSSTRSGAWLAPHCGLDEVRAALPADVAVLEYHALADELIAFVVSSDGGRVVRGLASRADLQERTERLRFQLARALRPGSMDAGRGARLIADAKRELYALWQSLIDPLKAALPADARLVIVPHGPLFGVPFQALFDGQQYLVDRWSISYSPSASLLAREYQRCELQRQGGSEALLVGVADPAAPRIEDEVRRLAELMPEARRLIGPEATAEAVLDEIRAARIVHLACHGRYSRRFPLSSGLKLADRWLTVQDVYNLRLEAELVTLSGCETGRNTVEAGDELFGFVRGFLSAGARSLLVSQWLVNDAGTAEMMNNLYKMCYNSGACNSWSGRLRNQQLELKLRCEHPLFWAPFILVGKP